MPYTIIRDGREFCVHKLEPDGSTGERIACHDSRKRAAAQIAAISASEAAERALEREMIYNQRRQLTTIWKGEDGLRHMFIIASNSYEDREDEIVKQQALQAYVDTFSPNPVLMWHGGDPIGEVIEARMSGPFLIEIARELPDERINLARGDDAPIYTRRRLVWDMLEETEGQWGASIGFQHRKGDEQDGAYDAILKVETSVLPIAQAANAITFSKVIR